MQELKEDVEKIKRMCEQNENIRQKKHKNKPRNS